MDFKAIIFDLDGTLLNTLQDIGDAVNRALSEKGFPVHDKQAFRYFVGDGARALVRRALPEAARSEANIQKCLELFEEYYRKNWNTKTGCYDGVPEMLDGVMHLGLKMAVLSNKPHEFTCRCVEKFLAAWHFESVAGFRNGFPRKPDPSGALRIAEKIRLDPERFLYLGDSGVDMKTATAAGMFPVGAGWGFRTKAELMENGCRFYAKHPSEVLTLLPS